MKKPRLVTFSYLAALSLLSGIVADAATAPPYRLIALKTGSTQLVEVNTTTGATSSLFTLPFTTTASDGFDYNPADGFLYISHPEGSGIVGFYQINLIAKTVTRVKQLTPSGDGSIESLGFTPEGNAYCYDEGNAFNTGTMNYVTWSTTTIQTRGSTNTPSVLGGDYDAVRNVFWATDEWNGKIYQLNPTNSSVIWTSTSSYYPGNGSGDLLDMDVAPNGDILVAGGYYLSPFLFKIMKLDPVTGILSQWLTMPDAAEYRIASVPTSVLDITTTTNGSISGAGEYAPGATATLTATPSPGYVFMGWTGAASGTKNPLSIVMDANKSVGATFAPDTSDSDGDGLSNYDEIVTYQTNPLLKDTDSDGFDDLFEVNTGFNPALASSSPDAVSSIRTAVEFRFSAAAGAGYRVESSTDLQNWTVQESSIVGLGGVVTRFYSIENQPKRYFRVRRN
jgi:uncharacterized repeat protein (TIGR02543 family)